MIIRGFPLEMQNNESKTPYEYAFEKRKYKIASILKLNNTCCDNNIEKLEQKNIHNRLYYILLIVCTYKLLVIVFADIVNIPNIFIQNLVDKNHYYFIVYYFLALIFEVLGFAIFIAFKKCLRTSSYLIKVNINLKKFIEVKNLFIKGRI